MPHNRRLTFYHAPHSRSTGTLILLEELGADYELRVLNLKAGDQRQPEFLAINPMGKVPTIQHGDTVVTEQVAIHLYLADLYGEAGLAPPLGDPLRGAYLRWMVYYGSCFEPALMDRSMQRQPGPASRSPYGDYETMFNTVADQLARGPYILGERFTAADILWGTGLTWATRLNLIPELPLIREYFDRINARPAVQRVRMKDVDLAEALEKRA